MFHGIKTKAFSNIKAAVKFSGPLTSRGPRVQVPSETRGNNKSDRTQFLVLIRDPNAGRLGGDPSVALPGWRLGISLPF